MKTNATAVGVLTKALQSAPGNENKSVLSAIPVDIFCAISNYENNRDVAERAAKQAKSVGAHLNGDVVAVVLLDKERNKALWERTEKQAIERKEPHTLPFIKADGHTRAYGWTTLTGEENKAPLFTRPESLFVTVHKGLDDTQIYNLVKEYCDGVSKASNKELQQMGMKKAEYVCVTDFVTKDSWKTAFRTISRDLAKDMEGTLLDYKEVLAAIDNLDISTKATTKKLSGVRAALIKTHETARLADNMDCWVAFWTDFYSAEPQESDTLKLIAKLGNLGTGNAPQALEACEVTFKKALKVKAKAAPKAKDEPELTGTDKAIAAVKNLTEADLAEALK